MKTGKAIAGFALCVSLVCILAGGGIFYARRNTAAREKKIQDGTLSRLSAFTEVPERQKLYLCAFRGLSATYPENTLPAIRAAGEAGYSHILLDVAVTRDKTPVLLSDDAVERMTTGRGLVRALTLEELARLPIDNGAGLSQQTQTLHIPTLADALDLCEAFSMTPVLHVRTRRGQDELLRVLRAYGAPVLLVSGQKAVLRAYLAEGYACIFRTDAPDAQAIAWAQRNGTALMANAVRSTPEQLRQASQTVPLWAENVRLRSVLRDAVQNGATRIVTDCILPMQSGAEK